MKILNFVPLLIWMLGFLALGIWEIHLNKSKIKDIASFSKTWIIGIVGWLIIGIALSI